MVKETYVKTEADTSKLLLILVILDDKFMSAFSAHIAWA